MKALVTGGGGFLGLYIVEQLVARGDTVRTFSRKRYKELEELDVEQHTGDIQDADIVAHACEGVDTVFHVAAIPGIWGPWSLYHGINTLGTENVLSGSRRHDVRRLVYTSSPSVTFDGATQESVDESVPYPTRWLCHYPHSKALAEKAVLDAHSPGGGLLTCSLRPHLIWGPRDPHLVPRLIARARTGRLRRVGDGTNLVDMIYVANAATAHLQAADALDGGEAGSGGKAYFISQGEPVNCWGWIDEILALAGLPPVKRSISISMAKVAGAILEGIHTVGRLKGEPMMTRFLASQLGVSHYFDITAARRDFGYAPPISTEDGMALLREDVVKRGL